MSQYFLVVKTKRVVDQPFKAAEFDGDGNEISPEVPLIAHDEVDGCYIEDAPAAIASLLKNQADDPDYRPNLKPYALKFNDQLRPTTKRIRIKSRAAAPVTKETVTVEDTDGNELGAGDV